MNQRLVNSATILLNSFRCSGVSGFLPILLAYSLAFCTLEYLLSDAFGTVVTVVTVFIISISIDIFIAKLQINWRIAKKYSNLFVFASLFA